MQSRRAFLKDLGQGTLAVAIFGFGFAACSSEAGEEDRTTTAPAGDRPTGQTTSSTSPPTSTSRPPAVPDGLLAWERVTLGSVSAYLLVRAGEIAIVDTGNPGSVDAIGSAITGLQLGWPDVSHVILTHLHRDHIGSLGDVMAAAPDAAGFAGEPDLPSIPAPRPLAALCDGDSVFGLEIIATPGHTPGSISVFDRAAGVLVAGDALNGVDGGVAGANPRFSTDMAEANASVRKLAGFEYDTILFGHGEPVLEDGAALVGELANGL